MIDYWPADWFGNHRAYRVNRAILRLERALRGVNGDLFGDGEISQDESKSEKFAYVKSMQFEAAAFTNDGGGYPPRNFTIINPIATCESKVDPDARDRLLEQRQFISNFIAEKQDLLDRYVQKTWRLRAINDLNALSKEANDELFLRCFDHCVGLLTRIPLYGYVHEILCRTYLRDRENRENCFHLSVSEGGRKPGVFGQIRVFSEDDIDSPSLPQQQEQRPTEQDKEILTDSDRDFIFGKLLPLVSFDKRSWIPFGALEMVSIPVHTIHELRTPSYGPFIGWLHIEVLERSKKKLSELKNAIWPLLDGFGAELLDGEVHDMLANYDGHESPKNALLSGIHKLSGWEKDTPENCEEISGLKPFGFNSSKDVLTVRLGTEDDFECIALKLKSTTCFLPDDPRMRDFALNRFVYRVRGAYVSLSTIFAQSESDRLRKYQQMLESLSKPLNGITDALVELQRDTQELRAVLYDPAKALFESSPRIRDLFEPNQILHVSDLIRVETSHGPESYNKTEPYSEDRRGDKDKSWQTGVMVMLVAVCRVFGVDRELSEAVDFDHVRTLARIALGNVEKNKSFEELFGEIFWLANGGGRNGGSVSNLTEFLELGESFEGRGQVGVFLSRLKATLFSPFKIDLDTWDLMAVELAIRAYRKDPENFETIRGGKGWPKFRNFATRSPVAYSTLLDFLIGICLSKEDRKVESLGIDKENSSIVVTFSEGFSREGESLSKTIQNLRDRIDPIAKGYRDWRLVGANVGDWEGPFIELANRAIGIVPKAEAGVPQQTGWVLQERDNPHVVILLVHTGGKRFSVAISDESSKGKLEVCFPEA